MTVRDNFSTRVQLFQGMRNLAQGNQNGPLYFRQGVFVGFSDIQQENFIAFIPKKGEQFRSVLDVTKLREVFGWDPQVTLQEGLTRTVDFFRGTGK